MRMNCADYREWTSASIDRRLDAAQTGELAAHLAGCPECRRAHEDIEAGDALLRKIDRVDLPAGFEDRVMALATAPAPAAPQPRRGSLLAPLFTCAAAAVLLVVLGIAFVTPPAPTPELRRDLGKQIGGVEAVLDMTARLPEEDPKNEGIGLLRAEIAAVGLRDLTTKLGRQNDPDIARHVQDTEAILRLAELGDVKGLRVRARQTEALAAARALRTRLALTVETPKPMQITVSGSVPVEYINAVRGHLHHLNGDHLQAVADFDLAVQTYSTFLMRADAHTAVGNVEGALADYTAALNATSDAWTTEYVANSLKRGQGYTLWINEQPVRDASVTVLADALKGGQVTFCWASAAQGQYVVVGPEHNSTVQRLGGFKGVRYFRIRGVAKAEVDVQKAIQANPAEDAVWLQGMMEKQAATREK